MADIGRTADAAAPGRLTVTRAAVAVASVVAIALAARVSVALPGTPVPQSLQTLAVVLVGAFLGARAGALAVAAYLLVGALGAPVFADGAAGADVLAGPTGGYLVGFVVGAGLVGAVAERAGGADGAPDAGGAEAALAAAIALVGLGALAAHAVILGVGWLRLSWTLSPAGAWTAGVTPFLGGGLVKSALAAGIWGVVEAARPSRRRNGVSGRVRGVGR